MSRGKKYCVDTLFSLLMLGSAFVLSFYVESRLGIGSLEPAMFALAVFLISLKTNGYIYGIVGSALSVLALNFAFTFPYFKFNFYLTENLISALIMLCITISTSALMTKVRKQEKIKAENEKEKMRANLLRAVSHDLRTPLTTIYGSSSAIIEKYEQLNKEQILQLAGGIKEDSEWLMGMVENLLSVTKIDNQGVKLKTNPVVLEELIDSVLIRFRRRYPKQKILVEIPNDFIIIPMDALLIEQVIVNLLENAVQHAEGMTELKLCVHTDNDNAVFEIIDNGCGIPKDRMESIFTGYYEKKDAPIDHQKRSMGIGLSVCASIIKAHGSKIGVRNLKEGGCCFHFSLIMETIENE